MAKEKKEAMSTFNDIMGDLSGLANDIGMQLKKDEVLLEKADQNMEDAENNMDDA